MSTLKSSLLGTSRARHLYQYILFSGERNSGKHKKILSRFRDTCDAHKIALVKYVCGDKDARACKTTISRPPVQADGVTDSINHLLSKLDRLYSEH